MTKEQQSSRAARQHGSTAAQAGKSLEHSAGSIARGQVLTLELRQLTQATLRRGRVLSSLPDSARGVEADASTADDDDVGTGDILAPHNRMGRHSTIRPQQRANSSSAADVRTRTMDVLVVQPRADVESKKQSKSGRIGSGQGK